MRGGDREQSCLDIQDRGVSENLMIVIRAEG